MGAVKWVLMPREDKGRGNLTYPIPYLLFVARAHLTLTVTSNYDSASLNLLT